MNFRALKKPTSWERTEQRAVIKYGKAAEIIIIIIIIIIMTLFKEEAQLDKSNLP